MTDRLYYSDPFEREFDATVVSIESPPAADGSVRLRLDRTCFYPTSGGQPFDTGTLDGSPVVDVVDEDDGGITHVLRRPAPAENRGGADPAVSTPRAGDRVHGIIDWARRFDHMQQHTGQHVLSAAIVRLFDVRTLSFHLGAEASTIDLARELTVAEITAVEEQANRIVWEDRPVRIRFVKAEEAAALPLRKESGRTGTLRLIDVENFDLSACGGTHVARTGQIGLIAITAWERFKGGHRLEFHCGSRALSKLRTLRDASAAAARLLSVPAPDVPAAIERLQTEARDQRRTAATLQMELARSQADALAASAESTTHGRLVLRAVDADASTLKTLATSIGAGPGLIAVLVSTARPALVVVSRSKEVNVAANELVAHLTATFGGRGGGKADLAQGGGLDASAESILDEARRYLSRRLG
jgi:alanyl-tRNA synthetase